MNLNKKVRLLLIFLLFGFYGYSQNPPSKETPAFLKDFMSYWTYYSYNTELSDDFVPLDESKKEIKKMTFLNRLLTSQYIPIRLMINNKLCYQLYKLSPKTDIQIKNVIKQMAESEIKYSSFVGKKIPNFNFTDVEGKKYDAKNTKGKFVVMKFWFIRCGACVKEMPHLNEIVKQYSNRKDIVFLSLANDPPKQLKAFLRKTTFDYAVASISDKYVYETVGIQEFPTHILIDKNGFIVKVMTSAKFLPDFLSKMIK